MTKYVRDPTNLCVNDSDTIILGLHPPLRFVINRSALVLTLNSGDVSLLNLVSVLLTENVRFNCLSW